MRMSSEYNMNEDDECKEVLASNLNSTHPKDKTIQNTEKLKWSSRFEFIISLLGYSLGLGDIWRVPYLVYRNGGGAFLIPYVICMLTCGIPLYFLELFLSQFSGKGPWRIWDICPLLRGFGITFAILNWLDASYAIIIRSWVMDYFINSFSSELPWASCNNWWNTDLCYVVSGDHPVSGIQNSSLFNSTTPQYSNFNNGTYNTSTSHVALVSSAEEFWEHKVLRRSSGLYDYGSINGLHILYIAITLTFVYIGNVKSVQSIGKIMYVTAIGPIILVLVIWIRALTLPGSGSGMLYFITPDFQRLNNIQVWIEAAFMSFYTLGPGWGGLMMMGSHNRFRENCLRDAVVTTISVILYGMLNGLVVFSVIGVMATELKVPISNVLNSGGFSLAFIAYPQATSFFPFPQVWSALFFIMLYLPGVDALMIMVEPVLTIMEELFPKLLKQRRVFILTGVIGVIFLVSMSETTQAGVYILQLMDWFVPTWAPFLISIAEAYVFCWIYGCDRISRDVQIMLGRPLPHVIRFCAAFIIPFMLPILLCMSFFKYKPPSYDTYVYPESARIIGWCLAMFVILPGFGFCLFTFMKARGSVVQRLKQLSTPNAEWKPAEESAREMFNASERAGTSSFKQKFIFSLTGKGGFALTKTDIDLY